MTHTTTPRPTTTPIAGFGLGLAIVRQRDPHATARPCEICGRMTGTPAPYAMVLEDGSPICVECGEGLDRRLASMLPALNCGINEEMD